MDRPDPTPPSCPSMPATAAYWRYPLLLALAIGGLFSWSFFLMWQRWHGALGYYSHGPLIPPIALVMAFWIAHKRGVAMELSRGATLLGGILTLLALSLHLAALYARIGFVSGFMLLTLLMGILLILGGWPLLKTFWFPVAFLAFMVPLPDITIGSVNFSLKMAAAQMSTTLVGFLGIPVYREGSLVFLEGHKQLTIEEVCSGLRSLIALVAFATLFSYICGLRGYRRWLLFFSAIPIAVAANVVRISVLILIAHFFDTRLAGPGGWPHDLMGYAVFIVAFCLLFIEETLLKKIPGRRV